MCERGIYVLGRGASGQAAAALARALGYAVTVADDASPLPARGADAPDFAVVSPGFALEHPLVKACRERGVPLKSELQFGCEALKKNGWRLLAVTGSKGKSSVVKLVADALGGVACGNYGRPVSDVALEKDDHRNFSPFTFHFSLPGWAIVEVSSFQLETTELPPDCFEAAAILNLQEDHLDRHGTVAAYHALKRKLLAFTRRPFECPQADAASRDLARGSYFDNAVLADNAAAAVALLRAAGLDDAAIRAAFLGFRPLVHRFETVAETGGVKYIDDSKATSLAALAAGVKMASSAATGRTVRLIAGGLAKGDDPEAVAAILTNRVKKVYLIGSCAEVFFSAWSGAADCEICGTLERAVETARREAQNGETVLLSPGCASFDQFKSFGERGEVFAGLVKRERKSK